MTTELEEMETESGDSGSTEEESYTMMQLLRTKALYWPLFIAIMLQVIQQLSGINAVSFHVTLQNNNILIVFLLSFGLSLCLIMKHLGL